MSTFKTGNPTLTEKIFDKSLHETAGSFGVMSIRGTMNKFGFLLLMVMASAMFIWNIYAEGNFQTATTLMLVGGIGGFILALVIMFKPTWAGYIVPAYGILEGLFLRTQIEGTIIEWQGDDLKIEFGLPTGTYATGVLSELIAVNEA